MGDRFRDVQPNMIVDESIFLSDVLKYIFSKIKQKNPDVPSFSLLFHVKFELLAIFKSGWPQGNRFWTSLSPFGDKKVL